MQHESLRDELQRLCIFQLAAKWIEMRYIPTRVEILRTKLFGNYWSSFIRQQINQKALELAKLYPPFSVLEIIDYYNRISWYLNRFHSSEDMLSDTVLNPVDSTIHITAEDDRAIKSEIMSLIRRAEIDDTDYLYMMMYQDWEAVKQSHKNFTMIQQIDFNKLNQRRKTINRQLQPILYEISGLPERMYRSGYGDPDIDWSDWEQAKRKLNDGNPRPFSWTLPEFVHTTLSDRIKSRIILNNK